MAWRKADNWTAFTNGYKTWLNGPNGLVFTGSILKRSPGEAAAPLACIRRRQLLLSDGLAAKSASRAQVRQ